jgi:hypothetical protein
MRSWIMHGPHREDCLRADTASIYPEGFFGRRSPVAGRIGGERAI